MAELQKAKLQAVKADENQTPEGDAVAVQFNPASLRLKLTNQSSGGRSRGQQRRQNMGQSSTVLSMDLIFDSADEGTDEKPVSVREKTNLVEKFVLPKKDSSEAPPLLRFEWDKLIIVGVVENIEINFDHFAANGAPLRAKMGLSIKEQNPKYTYLEEGKGKKDASNSQKAGGNAGGGETAPGQGTNDPANSSGNNSDRSDSALDKETAAEFLTRQGLNPAAWRGLDVDLSAGLSLEAGVEVGFSAGLSASVGVGVSAGVQVDAGVSLEASLGISSSAVFSASANASSAATTSLSTSSGGSVKSNPSSTKKLNGDAAGLALSAAGGIQSAIETVKTNETQNAAVQAQSAFGQSVGAASNSTASAATANTISSTATVAVSRTPLATEQLTNSGVSPKSTSSSYSATVIVADPRSTSYGYGVPLQPLYAASIRQTQVSLCSQNPVLSRGGNGPAFRKQKTTAPWVAYLSVMIHALWQTRLNHYVARKFVII